MRKYIKVEGVDFREIKTVTMSGVPGIMRADPKFSNQEVFKMIFDIETDMDILYPQRGNMLSLDDLETELGIVEENYEKFLKGKKNKEGCFGYLPE